jgi:hypothetical protein
MNNKVLAKIMHRKYENKIIKVSNFITDFINNNKPKINSISNMKNADLVEDLEFFCYNNKDNINQSDMAKLIVGIYKLKNI